MADKSVQMKQYNGSSYDNINPQTKASLVSTTADTTYTTTESLLGHLSKEYSLTLSANGWTQAASGAYTQALTVSGAGITSASNIIIDCSLSGSDLDADIEILTAWGCVNYCAATTDTLTFHCYATEPTVSIPLTAVVSR